MQSTEGFRRFSAQQHFLLLWNRADQPGLLILAALLSLLLPWVYKGGGVPFRQMKQNKTNKQEIINLYSYYFQHLFISLYLFCKIHSDIMVRQLGIELTLYL